MRPVVHFSVYADQPERAIGFYQAVFGWSFEAWGPPGYWKIRTGEGDHPGLVDGALSQRTGPRGEGTPNAFRCTISVADLDATLDAVEANGGQRHGPVADIPHVGRVGEFMDCEGNLVCAMQYAPHIPLHVAD